jgi:hypothetical protein
MEKAGFFTTDTAEACEALEQGVFKKKVAGLEISPAPLNPGMGAGIRRTSALNRIDLPMLWRALIQRPAGKKDGPTVALLAPRGAATAPLTSTLTSAGVLADMVAGDDQIECRFQPATDPDRLVDFSVSALRVIGGLGVTNEWMWAIRNKGLVPR